MENWKSKLETLEKGQRIIIDYEEGDPISTGIFESFTEDGRAVFFDEHGQGSTCVIFIKKYDDEIWKRYQEMFKIILKHYNLILDIEKELDKIDSKTINKGDKIILWDDEDIYQITAGIFEGFPYDDIDDISYREKAAGEILERSSALVYKFNQDKWDYYIKRINEFGKMEATLYNIKNSFKAIYTPDENENKYSMQYYWRNI